MKIGVTSLHHSPSRISFKRGDGRTQTRSSLGAILSPLSVLAGDEHVSAAAASKRRLPVGLCPLLTVALGCTPEDRHQKDYGHTRPEPRPPGRKHQYEDQDNRHRAAKKRGGPGDRRRGLCRAERLRLAAPGMGTEPHGAPVIGKGAGRPLAMTQPVCVNHAQGLGTA